MGRPSMINFSSSNAPGIVLIGEEINKETSLWHYGGLYFTIHVDHVIRTYCSISKARESCSNYFLWSTTVRHALMDSMDKYKKSNYLLRKWYR